MTPADVERAALALVGTPYQHQGRVPGRALDCIGLVVATMRALSLPVRDFIHYGPMPAGGVLERMVAEQLEPATGPHAGCMALIRWMREPQHCGVLTADGRLIHAYQSIGRVVVHGVDEAWRARMVAFYAFPGVSYPNGVLHASAACCGDCHTNGGSCAA